MEITNQFLVLVPVVVGVVEVLKKFVSKKFAPLVSLVLGVLGIYLLSGFALTGGNILEGVVVGLTASGLYSGVRKTME